MARCQMDRRALLLGALAAPLAAAPLHAETPIKLRDLYNKDLSFSDAARALQGERIAVEGYMAPPLKADSHFFVLTRRPMAVCPFCESEAEWPDDILAVYTKRVLQPAPFNVPLIVRGVLDLGGWKDPEFGFYSRVRLIDASHERR